MPKKQMPIYGRVRFTKKFRNKIFNRDGRKCKNCGFDKTLTVDHIIPIYIEPSDKEYRKTDNLDCYLMDKEMYRRSLQAFDSSFVRVANPEIINGLELVMKPSGGNFTLIKAPEGMTFKVHDKPQQSTSSGESSFSIRTEFVATLSLPTDNTGKEGLYIITNEGYKTKTYKDGELIKEETHVTVLLESIESKPDSIPDFEKVLQIEIDKLPYTKHLDDGQYNDGVCYGYEMGARWAFQYLQSQLQASEQALTDLKERVKKLTT